jgi:hypothetical protein
LKLPLGALLTFVGYAILWTGIMNLKVTYSVSGSTVTPSGKTFTLMDAFTCGEGATPATTKGPSASSIGGDLGSAAGSLGNSLRNNTNPLVNTPGIKEIGNVFNGLGTVVHRFTNARLP